MRRFRTMNVSEDETSRGRYLANPTPVPSTPKAPEPSAAPQQVEAELNQRIEQYAGRDA
jgi:hypothetical protein